MTRGVLALVVFLALSTPAHAIDAARCELVSVQWDELDHRRQLFQSGLYEAEMVAATLERASDLAFISCHVGADGRSSTDEEAQSCARRVREEMGVAQREVVEMYYDLRAANMTGLDAPSGDVSFEVAEPVVRLSNIAYRVEYSSRLREVRQGMRQILDQYTECSRQDAR